MKTAEYPLPTSAEGAGPLGGQPQNCRSV